MKYSIALLAVLVIFLGAGLPAVDKEAPNFTLLDTKGKKVGLKDFKGKNVLLAFTTTWCPYCKLELNELKEMQKTYKSKGLEIVAIYLNENPAKVAAYATAKEINYTVLVDPDGAVAREYNIFGVPTKVLVGKDGKIYCWMCRSMDVTLKKLLDGKKF